MDYRIDEKAAFAAYKNLSSDQKERFFPGEEDQAKKAIASLACLLGSRCDYSQLLMLYITVATRNMMGFDNDRISVTVKARFSDIVPENKVAQVIECISRISHNYSYIEKLDSPEMQAFDNFFDVQFEGRFSDNEKRLEDATLYPGFGTNPDNPIFAHSSAGSYSYLNLLYTSEVIPLSWNRVGSMEVESSIDPLDEYELILPDGKVYCRIYINMYARESSRYCPQGLHGNGLIELSGAERHQPSQQTADSDSRSEDDEYLAFLRNYAKDADDPPKRVPDEHNRGKTRASDGKRSPVATAKNEDPAQTKTDEKLSESSTPVLQGNLPVMLGKSTIFKKGNGEVYATCAFLPITDISIRAMQVDIICYDTWHEKTQPVEGFQYIDLKTERESPFGSETIISLPDPKTRAIEVIIRRILYADGSMLQRSGDNVEIPSIEELSSTLGSKELVEEYKEQTYKNAKYTPVRIGAFWRCTCGAINRDDETACHKCSDQEKVLFGKLDKTTLQGAVDEKMRLLAEKAEKERIAREEARKKAEEEQRAKREKEAKEAQVRAEKRKVRNRRIAIGSAITVTVALAVYLIGWQIVPSSKYKKADNLLSAGDRAAAFETFSSLGKFKDSYDRACAIRYEDAKAAFEVQDYDTAFELFSSITDYNDSARQAKESVYQKAFLHMEAGEYAVAADLFDSISGYKQSKSQSSRCRNEISYSEALSLLEEGKFKDAGEAFESLKSFHDSSALMLQSYYLYAKELIEGGKIHDAYLVLSSKVNAGNKSYEDSIELANTVEYQYASNCFDSQEYKTAAESFSNIIDYKDSENRALESQYQYGLELITKKKYDEAEKLFVELGKHKDSAKQANEAIYQHGISLLEAGIYPEAIKTLERLDNYRDGKKQLNEAKYQYALDLMSQKKYSDAEKLFQELGNYSDSAKQLKEAKYQRALGLVKDKYYIQAVNAFKELGNYSDSVERWKAAMYSYVTAHKNNSDKTTYEYLQVLSKANYKDCKKLYDNLYAWKATIVINTSSTDKTTKKTTVSPYDTIYCHFTLDGGPPGEVVGLKAVGVWPWGSSQTVKWNGTNEWRRGNSSWCSWYFYNPSDRTNLGTFKFRLYIGSTLIGEASVKVS